MDRSALMGAMSPQLSADLRQEGGTEVLSDAEVMLRVRAGDQPAFEYLVQKYRRPLVSFMYRMARNPSAAEDLAQGPAANECWRSGARWELCPSGKNWRSSCTNISRWTTSR